MKFNPNYPDIDCKGPGASDLVKTTNNIVSVRLTFPEIRCSKDMDTNKDEDLKELSEAVQKILTTIEQIYIRVKLNEVVLSNAKKEELVKLKNLNRELRHAVTRLHVKNNLPLN